MNRTDQPENDQLDADRRRADALRWILAIAEEHHLPVPERIDLSNYDTGWNLHLHLDDEHADDVRRWGDTLDLSMRPDLTIDGTRRAFNCVRAEGFAPDVVFAGWDLMVIDSYCAVDTLSAMPLKAAA